MKKIHIAWIVLIIFCSLIIISGIFYLLYRLYINYIYKRKRFWNEITTLRNTKSDEKIDNQFMFLMPRQSIIPLVQEFLPKEFKKQSEQRKMVTQLQFNEPPLFVNNLQEQWDEMDTKSLFSSSTHTLYYTIREQTSHEESLIKYFSITSSSSSSSTEQISSQNRSSLQSINNSFNHNKNNSSSYILIDIEQINTSNYFSKMYKYSS